jgi:hypothetical protein
MGSTTIPATGLPFLLNWANRSSTWTVTCNSFQCSTLKTCS